MPVATRNLSGWIRQEPDIRDFRFSASPRVLVALPPSVELSMSAVPIFNQGNLGSCGPNAEAEDIMDAALRLQGLASCPIPSRLFIYYNARSIMGTINKDSGVDNRSLMKALNQYGWCDESLWAYNIAQYRTNPTAACYTQAATRKIVAYHAVPRELNQMKACLAGDGSTKGDTFLFGFDCYPGLVSDATAQSGIVPDPQPGEQPIGGHDILICGYDDAKQMFKFRNSWGAGWGQAGYGWISYRYATSQLASDFWTVTHSALPDPIPVPPEPPTPPVPTPGARTIVVFGASKVTVDGKEV